MTFNDLQLIDPILKAVQEEGYTSPTPIQAAAIPVILQHSDLLGCAQTGTGKTAAFAIPMLQLLTKNSLQHRSNDIQALILTPTRELAIQIGESFAAYGRHLRLKHTVIFGGVSQHAQVQALRRGVDILIATPGRLLDLISQKLLHVNHIKIFVLDEADRMLDMGFIHDVKRVITKIPEKRQTLFFSATMPPEIQKLADTILTQPQKVEVTPVSSTAETIEQSLYFVDKGNKKHLLKAVLDDPEIRSALVFTRTKHGADKVVKDLEKAGINAAAIHGNKSQNARQRALGDFKSGNIRVLVATDIAARGIDVEALSHVIIYELPEVPETYVHRIGRTGRAGASGKAIIFCDAEEKPLLRDIQKLIRKEIPVVTNHPYPMMEDAAPEAKAPARKPAGRGPQHRNGKRPANHGPKKEGRGTEGRRH